MSPRHQVTDIFKNRGARLKQRINDIIGELSQEDFDTLQNEPGTESFWRDHKKLPSILQEGFSDWLHDYGPGESGMAHERMAETYQQYVEYILDDPEAYTPMELAHALAFKEGMPIVAVKQAECQQAGPPRAR